MNLFVNLYTFIFSYLLLGSKWNNCWQVKVSRIIRDLFNPRSVSGTSSLRSVGGWIEAFKWRICLRHSCCYLLTHHLTSRGLLYLFLNGKGHAYPFQKDQWIKKLSQHHQWNFANMVVSQLSPLFLACSDLGCMLKFGPEQHQKSESSWVKSVFQQKYLRWLQSALKHI